MTDLHYLPATEALREFRARELSPVELSRDGVPTGLSIVGRTFDDVTVFRIAAAHEERMPWLDMPRRRPAL
jgi:Asp-tRNA(Asn)/Glu-tRNA(Gln) amidotransferase A subunit family amidase